MSNIVCVLDACSIINLIHIDEDDLLIKELKLLDIKISEKVFQEVDKNVLKKVEKLRYRNAKEKNDAIDKIHESVSSFRPYIVYNQIIKNNLGDSFFQEIKKYTEYDQENGEFCSTVLAFYLSRFEKLKLYFHTDDFPAKTLFDPIFRYQQIGTIEDTVDLLILLYRLSDKISEKNLSNLLNSLHAEYATDVKPLLNEIRNYRQNLSKKLLRDRCIRGWLVKLEKEIDDLTFSGINEIKQSIDNKRKAKYKGIADILGKYPDVFKLESNSLDILKKIKNYLKDLKIKKIYKIPA